MNTGDRVEIRTVSEYNGAWAGHHGTVMSTGTGHIGVEIDGHKNPGSKYGYYWFSIKSLKVIKEEHIMLYDGYKTVGVSFLSGTNTSQKYAYACYDESIKEGDLVVVQTGHHGLAVARVTAVPFESPVCASREIVAKVDVSAFEDRKERARKRAELKKAMDKKVQELQTEAIYEMLADKNPELREMLEQYRAL